MTFLRKLICKIETCLQRFKNRKAIRLLEQWRLEYERLPESEKQAMDEEYKRFEALLNELD